MVQPGKVVDMKCLVSPILRLPAFLITLLGTRGIRAVLAENFPLKRQLLVLRRSRRRAPSLCTADRWLFGFYSQFLTPRRLIRAYKVKVFLHQILPPVLMWPRSALSNYGPGAEQTSTVPGDAPTGLTGGL